MKLHCRLLLGWRLWFNFSLMEGYHSIHTCHAAVVIWLVLVELLDLEWDIPFVKLLQDFSVGKIPFTFQNGNCQKETSKYHSSTNGNHKWHFFFFNAREFLSAINLRKLLNLLAKLAEDFNSWFFEGKTLI